MNSYYNVYCGECETLVCHTSHPIGFVLCTLCLREREEEEERGHDNLESAVDKDF